MSWEAAAQVGGALLGGIFSAKGQSKANDANRKLAKENRDWQQMMSNTAVRRRMADMRAGGINPLMAAKHDATTPAGNVASMGNVGGAGVEGAVSTGKAISDGIVKNVEVANIAAGTAKTVQETSYLRSQEKLVQEKSINEVKLGLNLDQDNVRKTFENQILKLKIPEASSYATFWLWVQDASMEEIAVAAGKVGGATILGTALGLVGALRFGKKGGMGVVIPKVVEKIKRKGKGWKKK